MPTNIRVAIFNAMSVLHLIGADKFYLQIRHSIIDRHVSPCFTGNEYGINRIGN